MDGFKKLPVRNMPISSCIPISLGKTKVNNVNLRVLRDIMVKYERNTNEQIKGVRKRKKDEIDLYR